MRNRGLSKGKKGKASPRVAPKEVKGASGLDARRTVHGRTSIEPRKNAQLPNEIRDPWEPGRRGGLETGARNSGGGCAGKQGVGERRFKPQQRPTGYVEKRRRESNLLAEREAPKKIKGGRDDEAHACPGGGLSGWIVGKGRKNARRTSKKILPLNWQLAPTPSRSGKKFLYKERIDQLRTLRKETSKPAYLRGVPPPIPARTRGKMRRKYPVAARY